MPTVTTPDGTRLDYVDWGDGPAVVFTGVAMLGRDMWERQLAPLVDAGLRCIAYDRRGTGRSDQPWDGYDFDTLASDLATIIDACDLADFSLVGYAIGAGEVVRYLHRNGTERVRRLVLVSGTTPLPTSAPVEAVEEVLAADAEDMARDRSQWVASIIEPFFGSGGVSTPTAEWMAGLAMQSSLRACTELTRTLMTTDQSQELASVTVPTLIIHGTDDVAAPLDLTARRTLEALPDAELRVYEGARHGLFATHAAQLNQDLLQWLVAPVVPGARRNPAMSWVAR